MTLNLTVTTPRCIYQSADYRLVDLITRKPFDFETQKIVLVNAFEWSATVCFTGVGRTERLDVGEWLAERMGAIHPDDPFDSMLSELLKADDWLSDFPASQKRHSFSVGAFVGSEPVFVLVSNFEHLFKVPRATASSRLSVFRLRPTKPKTFVSGQHSDVHRWERKRLTALAAQYPEPQRMYSALAEVNRNVALRNRLVSPGCYTGYVNLIGQGGGCAHPIAARAFVPKFLMPEGAREPIIRLLDRELGPGPHRCVGTSFARSYPSDDYHETLLREKPDDPNVHSSYGAFLKEKNGDLEGAEREYRKALELDRNHVHALRSLALLLWERGDMDQAASLYLRAIKADPGNEDVTWDYARLLFRRPNDRNTTRDVLDRGIAKNPESGRLLLLRAELSLRDGNALDALEGFRLAREKGAHQATVQAGIEAGYSFALQVSGAPIGECIAAYRVAIALNPENSALRLNLAQLMFVQGENTEAKRHLQQAMKLGLDESAQLEAQFYLLSHTSSDPAEVLRTINTLLERGVRLRWNVSPNIETVSRRDPNKAVLLELVSKVMAEGWNQKVIDQVVARWPKKPM